MFSKLKAKNGTSQSPFIIAEMSGNHNGDIGLARLIVEEAAKAGADAVKFQTYTADTLTLDSRRPEFMVDEGLWAGRSLYDLYLEASTPWQWHEELFDLAQSLGLTAFSSPFDFTAVDFLETLNCPLYKIASPEIVDIPLIQHIAKTGKPVIMSSGMASRDEIIEAIAAFKEAGGQELALLHCVSGYPTPMGDVNLHTMQDKAALDGLSAIGLSDHTMGIAVPVAAVALGAMVIEKHMCLGRDKGGIDSAFSLDPAEFREMVDGCRAASEALGAVDYAVKPSEKQGLANRRSLYVVNDVKGGAALRAEDIRSVRPASGLHPRYMSKLPGRIFTRDVEAGTPLAWDMFEPEDK